MPPLAAAAASTTTATTSTTSTATTGATAAAKEKLADSKAACEVNLLLVASCCWAERVTRGIVVTVADAVASVASVAVVVLLPGYRNIVLLCRSKKWRPSIASRCTTSTRRRSPLNWNRRIWRNCRTAEARFTCSYPIQQRWITVPISPWFHLSSSSSPTSTNRTNRTNRTSRTSLISLIRRTSRTSRTSNASGRGCNNTVPGTGAMAPAATGSNNWRARKRIAGTIYLAVRSSWVPAWLPWPSPTSVLDLLWRFLKDSNISYRLINYRNVIQFINKKKMLTRDRSDWR